MPETANAIDATKTPLQVLEAVQKDHPPADKLLATTQAELDALAAFLTEKRIVTIPTAPPARGEGDAAVHARDHVGQHGHSRTVRNGGDRQRGLLQHDAARSQPGRRRRATSS